MKVRTKNDNGFVCANCGRTVTPLKYTSRDHCPFCLASLHIDINPGDRMNTCCGILKPIDLEYSQNKGYVLIYKCTKCNQIKKNKVANDDSKEMITKVSNKTYK